MSSRDSEGLDARVTNYTSSKIILPRPSASTTVAVLAQLIAFCWAQTRSSVRSGHSHRSHWNYDHELGKFLILFHSGESMQRLEIVPGQSETLHASSHAARTVHLPLAFEMGRQPE